MRVGTDCQKVQGQGSYELPPVEMVSSIVILLLLDLFWDQ